MASDSDPQLPHSSLFTPTLGAEHDIANLRSPLSVNGIVYLTFFLGVTAGMCMLIINERRCGLSRQALLWTVLVVATLTSAASRAAWVGPEIERYPGESAADFVARDAERDEAASQHLLAWRVLGLITVGVCAAPQRRRVDLADTQKVPRGSIWAVIYFAVLAMIGYGFVVAFFQLAL